MREERFFFFWKNRSPFSNWFIKIFEMNGIKFNCAEQAMMYRKALLFNDKETAIKILMEKFPSKQKALGRQVIGFDNSIWEKEREPIVREILLKKFSQDESSLIALFKTGNKVIVEASPYDQIWGIGLSEDDSRAHSTDSWMGLNLLGKLLMEVREILRGEFVTDKDISHEDHAKKVFKKLNTTDESSK